MSAVVPVAAAVILNPDGQVLLAQRPPGKHYAGYWEFPGGKVEPGETPQAALVRELREELGLSVTRAYPWLTQRYTYPHASVELHFFRVLGWEGEPHGHEGQAFAWQRPGDYTVAPLLPANAPILKALLLPSCYGISMAGEMGTRLFLERAEAAMRCGLKLLQVREKSWTPEQRAELAGPLREIARRFGTRVLLNGDAEEARATGVDGVHWSAERLMAARTRPADLLCAASCHDAVELAQAQRLDLDFVVVGPVRPTPTHPRAVPLGWSRFAELIAGCATPVYALGGLSAEDLEDACRAGAHGVALRRDAWQSQNAAFPEFVQPGR
jgi:8-oxo-dGTP diphosphatase